MLDPAVVVCLHVVPSRLQFIADCPKELGFHVIIESLEQTLSESVNIIVREEVRVDRALSFLDYTTVLRIMSKWTKHVSRSIEVDCNLYREI